MADNIVTLEQLRELFSYDLETGLLIRRVRSANCTQVGEVAGFVDVHGYRIIGIKGRYYKAHRLIWLHVYGVWPNKQIDHINGIRDDNRLHNLRDVEHSINMQNQKRAQSDNRSSGLLGAHWHNSQQAWHARIQVNKRSKFLGAFATPEEAHAAYLEAKRRLHEGCTI